MERDDIRSRGGGDLPFLVGPIPAWGGGATGCAACGAEGPVSAYFLAPSMPFNIKAPHVFLCRDCHARVKAHQFSARQKRRSSLISATATDSLSPIRAAAGPGGPGVLSSIVELRLRGAKTLLALALGLNELGTTTERGAAWTPLAVKRILKLAELVAGDVRATKDGTG